MSASSIATVREQIEATDWDALAWLMDVPKDQYEDFIRCLKGRVRGEWSHAGKPPEKPAGWGRREINADITRTGRAFIKAIERRGPLSKPFERAMIKEVARFLEQIPPPKRGAPSKRADRLATFLEHVIHLTYGFGGRVTFNRKARKQKGNIVDLLIELRPLLPPGLIRAELPMPLIERVCAQARHDNELIEEGSIAHLERFLQTFTAHYFYQGESCPVCDGDDPLTPAYLRVSSSRPQ